MTSPFHTSAPQRLRDEFDWFSRRQFVPTSASIDKACESGDNHRSKIRFANIFPKGFIRHARS